MRRRVRAPGRTSGRARPEDARSAGGRRWRCGARRAARRSRRGRRRRAAAGARPPRSRCSAARRRSASVGATSRTPPPVIVRRSARVAVEPELALEEDVELGEGQRPEQQRLVGPREPGDRRGVVEVGLVGRGEDRAARRAGSPRSAAGSARRRSAASGLAPGDRAAVERQPAVLAPARRRRTARSGASSCSARYASSGRGDDRGPRGPCPCREAGDPVEQVGVGEDRRAMRRHMPSYMPRWRRRRQPVATIARPTSAPAPEAIRGPLRTQPPHPRPDRPAAVASASPAAAR